MTDNSFGHLLRVTTWGESHGPAIGCGHRRRAAAPGAERRRYPGLARPPQARCLALHQPTPRARPGAHHRGRVRGPDDGNADRPHDRECRCARRRLRRDQGPLSSRPRRLHLPGQVRHSRLARLGPRLGARDRHARRRRRHRTQAARRRHHHPRRAGADRPARHRARALGLGRGRGQPVSGAPTPRRHRSGRITSIPYASRARRRAPSSKSSPRACRPVSALRSTASSMPTSRRR